MTVILIIIIVVVIVVVILASNVSTGKNLSLAKGFSNVQLDPTLGKVKWDCESEDGTYVITITSNTGDSRLYTTKNKSFSIPGFMKNSKYNVSVSLQLENGKSAPLTCKYEPPIPSKPNTLKAFSSDNGDVTVNWDKVTDNCTYSLQWKDIAGKWQKIASNLNTTNYNFNIATIASKPRFPLRAINNLDHHANLTKQGYFTIGVLASNDMGESSINTVNIYSLPSPTGFLAELVEGGNVNLTWTAVSNAVSYVIDYQTADSSTASEYWNNLVKEPITGNSLTIPLKSLNVSSLYNFGIASIDSKGNQSDYSLYTLAIPKLPTISGLVASYLNSIITLSWQTASSPARYVLKWLPNGSNSWQTISTDLPQGNSYSFNPATLNPIQSSYNLCVIPIDIYQRHGILASTTITVPPSPSSNFSINLTTEGNFTATWTPVTNSENEVIPYILCYKISGSSSWAILEQTNITGNYSNSINNLASSNLYTFGLTSTSLENITEISVLIVPPPIVDYLSGSYVDGFGRISWNCISINTISSYTLRWKPSGGTTWAVVKSDIKADVNTLDIKLSDLGNFSKYEFAIIVVNLAALQSCSQNVATVLIPNPPTKPTLLEAVYTQAADGSYNTMIQTLPMNGVTSYNFKMLDPTGAVLNSQDSVDTPNSSLISNLSLNILYSLSVSANGPGGQSIPLIAQSQVPGLPAIPAALDITENLPYDVDIKWTSGTNDLYYDVEFNGSYYNPLNSNQTNTSKSNSSDGTWAYVPDGQNYFDTNYHLSPNSQWDKSINPNIIRITPYNAAGVKGTPITQNYYVTPTVKSSINNVFYDVDNNRLGISYGLIPVNCTGYTVNWTEQETNKTGVISSVVSTSDNTGVGTAGLIPSVVYLQGPVVGYTYNFTITINNGNTIGPISNTFIYLTPSPSVPKNVQSVKGSYDGSNNAITVTWLAPKYIPEVPHMLVYNVTLTGTSSKELNLTVPDPGITTTSSGEISAVFNGINNQDKYTISITATNSIGSGSTLITNYTPTILSPVTGLLASYRYNQGAIRLSWNMVQAAASYVIYYKPIKSSTWSKFEQISVPINHYYDITPWYFSQVSADYNISLLVVDSQNNISAANSMATVSVGPPPSTNFQASYNATNGTVNLSCSSITDVIQYEWSWSGSQTGKNFTTTSSSSFNGAKTGDRYTLKLRAVNHVAANQYTTIALNI